MSIKIEKSRNQGSGADIRKYDDALILRVEPSVGTEGRVFLAGSDGRGDHVTVEEALQIATEIAKVANQVAETGL